MTTLLLGRSGQLGRALETALAPRGDLTALGRGDLDLGDPAAIEAALDRLAPRLIVNAAAYTAVDRAEDEPDLARAVNGRAPGVLAGWAAAHGAALVHYSTDYVFDGTKGAPYAETDPPAPPNVYGESKLAGERAVQASGAAHLILRTGWLYAAWGRNFVTTMLRLGAERDELRVIDDQTGCPTSVPWLVRTTLDILRRAGPDPAAGLRRRGGLVHAVCGGATSWHGLAEAVFAEARRLGLPCRVRRVAPIPTADYPLPARRPADSRLSTARLRDLWDIEPPAWQDALAGVMARVAEGDA